MKKERNRRRQFLLKFFTSFVYQIFGIYLTSFKACILFFVETLPFLAALLSIFRSRSKMDRFSLYLFWFSVLYSIAFALGNDNLGTAIRLRIPLYITIYVLAFRLYVLRHINSNSYQTHST
jgi:hypothetical protein